jgi:protein-S-isoprenylcysteine O-methyltransferase Ste14
MASWSRIARRIRVPLGFAFAAVYIWLARPSWKSIVAGGAIAFCGVALRALASGHVKKNAELTTTGPYAWTRNPLYVGSMIIGVGFAIAALNGWVLVGLVVLLLAIYLPVVRSEEAFLRQQFAGYDEYARRVPRFVGWPRPLATNQGDTQGGEFSTELYLKHREYNAAVGTLAMLIALAMKLFWLRQR